MWLGNLESIVVWRFYKVDVISMIYSLPNSAFQRSHGRHEPAEDV